MFNCPKCKGTKIECCQIDAVLATEVHVEDGELIYGEPSVSDATTDRFQCQNCGWKIPCGTDDEDLVAWLEKQP